MSENDDQIVPDASHSKSDQTWDFRLSDDGWECEFARFGGEVDLCVATKMWANGVVDVIVTHIQCSPPIAYAHRHPAMQQTSLITYGPADLVVTTVINRWEIPM